MCFSFKHFFVDISGYAEAYRASVAREREIHARYVSYKGREGAYRASRLLTSYKIIRESSITTIVADDRRRAQAQRMRLRVIVEYADKKNSTTRVRY